MCKRRCIPLSLEYPRKRPPRPLDTKLDSKRFCQIDGWRHNSMICSNLKRQIQITNLSFNIYEKLIHYLERFDCHTSFILFAHNFNQLTDALVCNVFHMSPTLQNKDIHKASFKHAFCTDHIENRILRIKCSLLNSGEN